MEGRKVSDSFSYDQFVNDMYVKRAVTSTLQTYLPDTLQPDDFMESRRYHSDEEFQDPTLEAMRIKIINLIDFMHENDLSYGETARMIMDNVFLHKP